MAGFNNHNFDDEIMQELAKAQAKVAKSRTPVTKTSNVFKNSLDVREVVAKLFDSYGLKKSDFTGSMKLQDLAELVRGEPAKAAHSGEDDV
jgi:hypothetical protein